jgi:heat shock protein HslJ
VSPVSNAHRRTRLCLLAALLVLVAAACDDGGGSTDTPKSKTTPLVGTNWILTDSPSLGEGFTVNDVSANFSTKRVSGSSGCNTYNAAYTVDGSAMTIGPDIASTRRACASGPTAVERAYLDRLVNVRSYAIKGSTLSLFGTAHAVLLAFASADAARAIEGNWSVTGFYTGNAIQSVINGTEITADFDTSSVSGSTGCSTYEADYTTSGSAISFGTVSTGDGTCADADQQRQADQYLAALALVRSYRATGVRLDLLRSGGTFAATFERAASN